MTQQRPPGTSIPSKKQRNPGFRYAPPATAQQVAARLTYDPDFRLRVIVHDNAQAVADNAREFVRGLPAEPSHAELIARVQAVTDPEVQALILDVPYLGGMVPLWDEGYQLLLERANVAAPSDGAPKIAGVIAGVISLVGAIVGGNNASQQAEDQQALLEMQLQAQREAAAAAAERYKRNVTFALYAAAFAVALLILWLALRNRNTATTA